MLTFNAGSVCDVCAEEYSPNRRPHSIACGHVFCGACCTAIVEKTSPRLSPTCPFCRDPFTAASIRLIRVDFASPSPSRPHSPPRPLSSIESNPLDQEDTIVYQPLGAKMLEAQVAKVAQRKCSVHEVRALHDTLRAWLARNSNTEQTESLHLSAALLRAILSNHIGHAQTTAALRAQIDDMSISKSKLETELAALKAELERVKSAKAPSALSTASMTPLSTASATYSRPASTLAPPSHPTSPTSYPTPPYPPLPRPLSSSASASASAARTTSLHQQLLQSNFRLSTPKPPARTSPPRPQSSPTRPASSVQTTPARPQSSVQTASTTRLARPPSRSTPTSPTRSTRTPAPAPLSRPTSAAPTPPARLVRSSSVTPTPPARGVGEE
ncbi:hypothetical protein OE88DRAFT_242522 [Heliocybe sulcata]|uniref:RING-type domain-containing protein n=1 Tax=Heliocybe sulcata TaxID=5364 RepID=A0A5C3MZ86_9AGAM|nr:hypothetical protein OE88DRAFT_242522 [Heliocybe sulcata]